MESLFKAIFFFSIFLFCLATIGVFLLIMKFILLFQPQIHLMGLIIS